MVEGEEDGLRVEGRGIDLEMEVVERRGLDDCTPHSAGASESTSIRGRKCLLLADLHLVRSLGMESTGRCTQCSSNVVEAPGRTTVTSTSQVPQKGL